MRTIWKYDVPITDEFTLAIPGFGRVVSVGLDPSDKPSIWVTVDTEADASESTFAVVGTGNPMPDGAMPVGTIRQDPFMWHVCQIDEEPFG